MKKRGILDEQQVANVVKFLRASMGDVTRYAERLGLSVEDTVRYMSLASRLREAREGAGLSLKEVAKRLKLPRYRIRDAESSVEKVVGEVLRKYVRLIGLGELYKDWSRHNPDLAKRISLRQDRSK
jgi:hypothetical protein